MLRAGAWVRDRLLLFDLGYYRFQLFACIERQGGYFLTRLKDRSNPRITAVHRRWRGRRIELVGQRLQDVLKRLRREELDVEVELSFRRRAYGGRRRGAKMRCRLVGVRDADSGRYHLYLTNIPAERLSAREVASTYAARWLVELAFKQLKSAYRLDDLPSAKRPVVEALLYAALITMVASRVLLAHLRRRLEHLDDRLPEDRWAALFAEVAQELLAVMVRRPRDARAVAAFLEPMLLKEAVDPNAKRVRLLARVEVQSGGGLWKAPANASV